MWQLALVTGSAIGLAACSGAQLDATSTVAPADLDASYLDTSADALDGAAPLLEQDGTRAEWSRDLSDLGQASLVEEIQRQLAELGQDPGPIDGIFGPRTARAIESFQRERGLAATGQVSIDVLAELQQARLAREERLARRAGRTRDIQQHLTELGFAPGPIDGIPGPLTEQAIKAFESSQGLPVTGQVSTHVLDRLREAHILQEAEFARRARKIEEVQTLLADLGYDPGPVDGVFGPMTHRAARAFRRDHGLSPIAGAQLASLVPVPLEPAPSIPEPTADLDTALAAYDSGDYATALQQWRLLARRGIAEAENNLGVMYQRGRGVPADPVQAANWYRRAAEAGHANAQTNLGGMYSKGVGVPQDDAEAVALFRLAAEQGQLDAQYNLGVKYATGSGVAKNPREALFWFSLAAERGDRDAQVRRRLLAATMSAEEIDEVQKTVRAWMAQRPN
ncbi:MAG: peptidoglycan-binding protein [Alphaproteobacteria bacterium]